MLDGTLKRRLLAGELLLGAWPTQPSPNLIEVCGLLGFDFAFVDAEHSMLNLETFGDLMRGADAVGLAVLVRVPRNDPVAMLPYLEAGAAGVVVPHVCSAGEAKAAVDAVKYYPMGSRGAGSSTRANAYGFRQSAAEYFQRANEQTIVIPMVEDAEGVSNIASIGKVPGVDLVFIGPGDLALSLGHGGKSGDPEVRAAIDRAFLDARAAGVRVGTVGYGIEMARQGVDLGAQLLIQSTDLLLAASAKDYLNSVRSVGTKS